MKTFRRALAGLLSGLLAFAPLAPALAQSQTGLAVKDGAAASQTLCTFTVTSQQISCHMEYVWNGSAWTLKSYDSSGRANVVVASSALPTGAATAAKQPALGTAGAASSDVLTVQGIASMTALKVDGSAVTQPVSASSLPLPTGAATAASQATANTSLASIDGKTNAPFAATVTTTITRPADTNAYAVNDAWADSTSAPTSGGFTLSNVCRVSGGHAQILGATIISSNDPATLLQGEIWLYDSAVTAVNDNAAFTISDSDAVKGMHVIPFTLASTMNGSGNNSEYDVGGLSLPIYCNGSANVRFLVKVKNAYTPASGEQLSVRVTTVGLD